MTNERKPGQSLTGFYAAQQAREQFERKAVDVLRAMEEGADFLDNIDGEAGDELRDARAAVAKLIEAARIAVGDIERAPNPLTPQERLALLRAALAGVTP